MNSKESAQAVIDWLDKINRPFIEMADQIWANPELAWKEFKASRLQADYLEEEGFSITWDVGGTTPLLWPNGERESPSWVSSASTMRCRGYPKRCSPQRKPSRRMRQAMAAVTTCWAPGRWRRRWPCRNGCSPSGDSGTVRYYGCPAEEKGSGKVFMARAGAFDDLDAALNFHPAQINMPTKGRSGGRECHLLPLLWPDCPCRRLAPMKAARPWMRSS